MFQEQWQTSRKADILHMYTHARTLADTHARTHARTHTHTHTHPHTHKRSLTAETVNRPFLLRWHKRLFNFLVLRSLCVSVCLFSLFLPLPLTLSLFCFRRPLLLSAITLTVADFSLPKKRVDFSKGRKNQTAMRDSPVSPPPPPGPPPSLCYWPPAFSQTASVTTHWHQQEHQGYIKMLLCWALWQHTDTRKDTKATLKCCVGLCHNTLTPARIPRLQ